VIFEQNKKQIDQQFYYRMEGHSECDSLFIDAVWQFYYRMEGAAAIEIQMIQII
jgi:hypothetical protein